MYATGIECQGLEGTGIEYQGPAENVRDWKGMTGTGIECQETGRECQGLE